MANEVHEDVHVVRDVGYERRQRVVESAPSTQQVLVSRISKFIWLVAGVVALLIAFRFILKLIAANPASGFASFIYGITDVLVAPFMGLTATPAAGSAVVDIAAVFALVVYILVAWIIVRLFRILFTEPNSRRRVTTYERSE